MHAANVIPNSSNAHILQIQNLQLFVLLSLALIKLKSQSRNLKIVMKNHDFDVVAIGFIPAPRVSNTAIMATYLLSSLSVAGSGFACISLMGAGYGVNFK